MKVLARKDIKVPKEGSPRDYITDTPPEGEDGYEVPDSAYYIRRELDGDLVRVPPPAPEVGRQAGHDKPTRGAK